MAMYRRYEYEEVKTMKGLSISNEKGGVGKTVIAANLAWELSRKGYLVVTIDLDQQADLTRLFLREEKETYFDIIDVLKGNCTVEEACARVKDNLYLIPGTPDIKHFDLKNSETLLREALKAEELDNVDLVIIDHPPSTSEASLLGHVAATDVLIVTDTEEFSVQNIGSFVDELARIQKTMNSELKVLGVVANRVDKRRGLTKASLKELERTFGNGLLKTRVSNNTAVPTAIHQGKVVRELGWSSPVLKQLKSVADEVEERMGLSHGNGQTEESQPEN